MALEEDDLKWRGDGETNMSKVLSMQLMLGASDLFHLGDAKVSPYQVVSN